MQRIWLMTIRIPGSFNHMQIIISALMRHDVDSFSPSSWEPQEEGMMNIAARFSLSKKPRFIDPKGKNPND
jgi:hypothetical protein